MTKKKFNWRTLCIILTFIFLYMPIGVLIFFSFNESDSTAVFSGFSLRWYKELFTDTATLNALKNTLILAVLSSIISTIIGTAAAYGISKMKNKYLKNATMSATQIPMINPEIVTGISMMLLFVFVANVLKISSFNGFWTVLIAHITFNLPYVILLVLPKFKEMDKSLPEAALDLGCTPFQSFFKVELPAIMPGIVAGFIMAFTLSIDDFVISYFTTGSGFETLPIRIYSMTKKRVTPDMYALSTLIFVTILVLLLISNFTSGKNKIELSKKAKKVMKIIGGSVFGMIGITTIVVLCISATTEVKTVNVYNWGEYISDGGYDTIDVNREFEEWAENYYKEKGKKVKVQVNYTTYASNEDLYSKIANGAGGYDIIVPSDYMLEKMQKEGLLQPLDLEKIPNCKFINSQFDGMFLYDNTYKNDSDKIVVEKDNKKTYGIAYTYGIIGIIYNSSQITEEQAPKAYERIESGEAGWELLFGEPIPDKDGKYQYDKDGKMIVDTTYLEELKGQILQFNNPRDAFGAAMYYLDIDVNNPTEDDWKAVYGLLATQKDYVQGYVMDEIYNKMEKGEAWIAAYYAGDCLSMMSESADDVELGFYYPKNKDGKPQTNVFADAMCIPASANQDNLELAHMYINFMLEPEIAYANAEYIYYGCPYDYTNIFDYLVFDENNELVLDENGLPVFDMELYEKNLAYVEVYRENLGEDYDIIYNADFENDLLNPNKLRDMFDKFAYKDLTNSYMEGTDVSNLDMLNESWEQLKVASTSMVGIYVTCLVIALAIVAYIVYVQIKKRKQRRLYWANTPTPKAKPKDEPSPDLSATAVIAIEKAKKRDKDSQK
ncbi:MAG: ABC transporter permease subunit [Clostridia bacterium]|nr:ABC transporter permease subunit [Clostridia bacterium]